MKMRVLGNLAILAATVALSYGMQLSKPHYADLTAPIPVDGAMHDTVRARSFDVRLDEVVFARALKTNQFGQQKLLTTSGVWAVVTTSLTATDASITVADGTWQGPTGLRYRQTERLGYRQDMPPHGVDPGLQKRGLFVFEVPPDQIGGARLLVSERQFGALDAQARISFDGLSAGADGQPAGILPQYDLDAPPGQTSPGQTPQGKP
ncbi:hypothetical protein FJ959_14670 [Mesorhizobium sp. B2-2-4]|uniref:hypothetical protein n=1 Tax=unclassified Mesorhizobium TaxID=325217 RepID=UPI00112962E5|nr:MULTISPECIES: hypothetical protein [unclassified Mesorhizobium]TPJ48735.1 hypothetical protein FJ437_05390 [Mesorhizobium sp. B2-6-6]MBZ9917521.1 hypothetical protein [Mesorhizobium sp. BR1-1-7]MBZ9953899.1 hypothetical protein [Mesorhizobium sp. BR1-1-15]MBZ9973630.1 hypothetical protein [Mesorhizobium sp. BR1-1-12]MCA0000007.1 hypothetical protein [Mesorhizobium sp. B264B2A]